MAVQRITKTVVERLAPGSSVWDEGVRGFGARRQVRDVVFVLKVRVAGRQRFFTIGKHGAPWTVEMARQKARSLLGVIADGKDPASYREEINTALSVQNLAALFMAEHVRPKRKASTMASYEHILNDYVIPRLGIQRAGEITRAEVGKLHYLLRDKPYLANRTLAVIASMYSWGRKQGLVPDELNPTKQIERFREHRRERFLSTDELDRLGAAIREAETIGIPWAPDPEKKAKHAPREQCRLLKISPHAAAALRLLLFTGARLREILNLTWDQVDVERGLLFLSDSKTGRKTIVVNAPALDVLANLTRVGTYVIAGDSLDRPRSDLKRPWSLILKRARLGALRIHDLRHSFASFGAGGGVGLPIIGKLLGHTQFSTTARYAHLDNDPVRRASEAIGATIAHAMGEAKSPAPTAVPVVGAGGQK